MKQNDDLVSWANITSPSSIIYIKGSILKKNLLLLGSKQAYTAISEYKENNVIKKKAVIGIIVLNCMLCL